MAVNAKLIITLKADEVVIATSEDPKLWQRIFAEINGTNLPAESDSHRKSEKASSDDSTTIIDNDGADGISKLAKRLKIDRDLLVGAISPSDKAPYLHLDEHSWVAMKKGTPNRGNGSVSPTGLAATLLLLWFKEAKIEVPVTQKIIGAVLDTVNVKDHNPSRGVKNTKWLQDRGSGKVIINPSEIPKAEEMASSFCGKNWVIKK